MVREALEYGVTYHIYNRGNNGETIFLEERNYAYFIKLYEKYIVPIADSFAYCLLGNHFHILLRIKDFPQNQELRSFNLPNRDLPGFHQELRSSENGVPIND
jgi:hypothetical protein